MLTRKQYELLVYIDRHLKQTGFSPSFEEMKDALNLKSKSGIHRLISALEERGYLARRHHRARALDVLRLPDNMVPRDTPANSPPEAECPPGSPLTSFAAISHSACRGCAPPAMSARFSFPCMAASPPACRSRPYATPAVSSK